MGAAVYTTAFPCWPCFKLLVNAGITRVVYGEAYRPDLKVWDAANRLGIEMEGV